MSKGDTVTEKSSDEPSALEELRRRERELSDFIENASIGLHWVGADGTILWANQAELDLLGYTREEYVGCHIAEFHADGEVIDE
jgi:PAS domain S-box-containing protein